MTKPISRKSFTIEEYHKLAEVGILKDTDRVELINGDIITMSPIKSPHAGMVDALLEMLIIKLYKKATIKSQNPIIIPNHSEPEPDIVIAKYRQDSYKSKHPEPEDIFIIIEVSDSTLKKDRTLKYQLYAKANISEYWIINLIDCQVEVNRQPKNGTYHFKQIFSEAGSIEAEALPFQLNYSDLFLSQ